MTLFSRKPKLVQTLVPHAGHEGHFRAQLPRNVADSISVLQDTIAFLRVNNEALKLEAEEITAAAVAMRETNKREHERQNDRIQRLVEQKDKLRKQVDAALAANKTLDAENIQLAAELLHVSGQLATAEERLAGYEKAAA